MSLSILKSERRIRSHTVYDLEWVPGTLEVRLVGVYDERGYRWYRNIRAFLENELTSENRGRWFYAHAGGLADIQFVFEEIITNKRYQVDAKFSGSSCIITKVKRGKNAWTFIDSYWLLRESLAKIGDWIGVGKGSEQSWKGKAFEKLNERERRDFYTNAPLAELIPYNERDCYILYRAIDEMQLALLEMGGQLQMTLASSAMQLFRRKYLRKNIETHPFVNEIIREAYFASRVEVFSRKCFDASYYDINSSFPFAMTMPCPGEYLGSSRRLKEGSIYFADVEISIPDTYLPPIPTRIAGRLFFPVGRWRTWLSSVDIKLLLSEGGRIEKLHKALYFAPFNDLSSYASDLYTRRKESPEGFAKVAYKLLLNSLYGKFAESPYKSALLIDPDPDRIDYETDEMFMPGIWLTERKMPVPHMHTAISAHITALARKTLFDYISICGEFHYCDTDGFSTTEKLSTGPELGSLKLEKLIREGTFIASKVYRLQGQVQSGNGWLDIESQTKHQGVKAKGFSNPSVDMFLKLAQGKEIESIRMSRVKELVRKGESKPSEKVIRKRLKLADSTPKRFTYPDGETRPWHIKELEPLK